VIANNIWNVQTIYSSDGAKEASKRRLLKSTMSGKLFHTLTIRSLENLARTVEEECFASRSPVLRNYATL